MVSYKKKNKDSANVPKKSSKKDSAAGAQHSAVSLPPLEKTTASTAVKLEPLKNIDEHPLQVGHYLVVKYRDGSNRLAKIVEGSGSTTPQSVQYYIHYCDFNRRMDEWISGPRIITYPSEANIMGAEREAQENAHKKMKSTDSKGNLLDAELAEEGTPQAPVISPKSLLGSGSQRSGQKSRSNSMAGGGMSIMAISTVADMDHDEHEGRYSLPCVHEWSILATE